MHCTARGIPIYVADAGASVVRDILAAPHRQAPDSLSRLRLTPTVRVVSRMLTIGTGDERLELRAARGRHASMMMLVWLPARRLLYASDVVIPDAFEPVFAAAYRGSSCGWCSARGSMWSGCSASTYQRRHGPSSCVEPRGGCLAQTDGPGGQGEFGALLSWVVLAEQRCDRGVRAAVLWSPGLGEGERVARSEHLVLHGLREHAAAAPPPHFAALGVEDDEVVGLTARETKFYALAGAVRDVKAELHVLAQFHVERRADGVARDVTAYGYVRMRGQRRRIRERQSRSYQERKNVPKTHVQTFGAVVRRALPHGLGVGQLINSVTLGQGNR